jgi:hypothetical protein
MFCEKLKPSKAMGEFSENSCDHSLKTQVAEMVKAFGVAPGGRLWAERRHKILMGIATRSCLLRPPISPTASLRVEWNNLSSNAD